MWLPVVMRAERQTEAVEGPTRQQALRMAATRRRWSAGAADALAAGQEERAFELDCMAWDLEMDLRRYGYDPETGHPAEEVRR